MGSHKLSIVTKVLQNWLLDFSWAQSFFLPPNFYRCALWHYFSLVYNFLYCTHCLFGCSHDPRLIDQTSPIDHDGQHSNDHFRDSIEVFHRSSPQTTLGGTRRRDRTEFTFAIQLWSQITWAERPRTCCTRCRRSEYWPRWENVHTSILSSPPQI